MAKRKKNKESKRRKSALASVTPDVKERLLQALKLHQEGALAASEQIYREILAAEPTHAVANHFYALVLFQRGDNRTALNLVDKALSSNPAYPQALYLRGLIYEKLADWDAAVDNYKQALQLEPNNSQFLCNLGIALRQLNQSSQAIHNFRRVLALDPDSYVAQWQLCQCALPILYKNPEAIAAARHQYTVQLQAFLDDLPYDNHLPAIAAGNAVFESPSFFLAYQGLDDRDLQEKLGLALCRLQEQRFPQYTEALDPYVTTPDTRCRVGFVSSAFGLHSVWMALTRGWVSRLDDAKFASFGYHVGAVDDVETRKAGELFDTFITGPRAAKDWAAAIRRDQIDVLIFPEIGMDSITLQLATLRLAPVQCASWGHPVTTGLPTIDYFLSGDLIEPPDAQNHYTEQLVRLPNLSVECAKPETRPTASNRDTYGFDAQDVLYFCCQSLYKYLPQYDDVFAKIAKNVKQSRFLFFEHHATSTVTDALKKRLQEAFALYDLEASDHCRFLSRHSYEAFLNLMAMADVYLDTVDFSGFNTASQALACALPVVTRDGALMKGKLASGLLKRIGVDELIAKDVDEYVAIATRLGKDPQERDRVTGKIRQGVELLYDDAEVIRSLEQFLLSKSPRSGSAQGQSD